MALYKSVYYYYYSLKPTSTKPQAEKLGQTYKIMVATEIYSVTKVLWKETAFPLCRAIITIIISEFSACI